MGEIRSGERRITTEDLNIRAARAAAGLKSLGVGFGDTVVIYLRNDFAFFEASLAAGLVGAYPVPANWHYNLEEARYLFENSGAKIIVIHADFVDAIGDAFPKGTTVLVVPTPPEIRNAYNIPADQCAIPDAMMAWDDWLMGFAPAPPEAFDPPGTMIYTSGTTGHPKGVRRLAPTLDQAQASTRMLIRGFGFDAEAGEQIVTVVTGPMYHSAPNAYGVVAAKLGGNVILQPLCVPKCMARPRSASRFMRVG